MPKRLLQLWGYTGRIVDDTEQKRPLISSRNTAGDRTPLGRVSVCQDRFIHSALLPNFPKLQYSKFRLPRFAMFFWGGTNSFQIFRCQ